MSLRTRDGTRGIWGKDIERAVAKSLTQPQVGDKVVVQARRSGQQVGVREVSENSWLASLMHYDLGLFDHEVGRIE